MDKKFWLLIVFLLTTSTLLGCNLPVRAVSTPTLVGPTLVEPTLVGPTLVGPTLVGPTLVGPTLVGPTPTSIAKAFTTSINANCRVGPSQLYPIVKSYLLGQTVIMDGRNDDASWLHVAQDRCWVSIITGMYNGDPTQLPVMEAPPLPDTPTSIPTKVPKPTKVPNPTMVPSSCGDLKTQQSCTLDSSCKWTKGGICINK